MMFFVLQFSGCSNPKGARHITLNTKVLVGLYSGMIESAMNPVLDTLLGRFDFLIAEHAEAVSVMRAIKKAIDPDNIMNPGKMLSVLGSRPSPQSRKQLYGRKHGCANRHSGGCH